MSSSRFRYASCRPGMGSAGPSPPQADVEYARSLEGVTTGKGGSKVAGLEQGHQSTDTVEEAVTAQHAKTSV